MNPEERLHFGFLGEPFLFPTFTIDSSGSFTAAAAFISCICFSERILTLAISRRWNPVSALRRTRLRVSIWRTTLYWVVTLERLLYMLAAMSLNLWILIVIVTSLAVGQFIIELTESPEIMVNVGDVNHPDLESGRLLPRHSRDVNGMEEPLLTTSADDYELDSASPYQREHHSSQRTRISLSASPGISHPHTISPSQMSPSFQYTPPLVSGQTFSSTTRPRSKSKPDEIFIHPTHSNIARAEVIADRMGFGIENSEYVDSSSYTYPRSPSQNSDVPERGSRRGWGTGNGREIARGLLVACPNPAGNAGW